MKRFLPLIALILIATSGLVAAAVVLRLDHRNTELAFEAVAEQASARLREHANRHLLLLGAAAAHFEASHDWMSAEDFRLFFDSLDLPARAPGSVGLGYLVFTERDRLPTLARAYELGNGAPLNLWPSTTNPAVAVAVLYETVEQGAGAASGFDSYSDPIRREALDRAIASGAPAATAPTAPLRGAERGRSALCSTRPSMGRSSASRRGPARRRCRPASWPRSSAPGSSSNPPSKSASPCPSICE